MAPTAISPEFTDWIEKDVVGDLTGDLLPAGMVASAKKEELSEMYRRSV